MAIGWYNGWSPQERLATPPIQREAVNDGRLARPTHCSICGSGHQVWFHNERYDRPLAVYPVCRTCHRILHERFELPDAWLALVSKHGGRAAWFERLSLNPASQRRPFHETYPAGISLD
jgi:hypothetical protein